MKTKLILVISLFIMGSCSNSTSSSSSKPSNAKSSSTTGWDYNNSKNGGFEQIQNTKNKQLDRAYYL